MRYRSAGKRQIRSRLFKSAIHHADRRQHRILQELRKGKTGRILENLTQYYVAAASIAPHRMRNGIDPNGRIIRGKLPVQTLQECRKRLAGRIAAKSWNRNSRGMAEQLPQSDLILCGELAVWNPPAFQVLVHVC